MGSHHEATGSSQQWGHIMKLLAVHCRIHAIRVRIPVFMNNSSVSIVCLKQKPFYIQANPTLKDLEGLGLDTLVSHSLLVGPHLYLTLAASYYPKQWSWLISTTNHFEHAREELKVKNSKSCITFLLTITFSLPLCR